MAKVTLKSGLGDYGSPQYIYDAATLILQDGATATTATLEDQYGATITFSGTGLKYKDGAVTGGTVSSITYSSSSGDMMVVTGGSFAASKIITNDLEKAFAAIYKGNDTFNGTSGHDTIVSGLNGGNDKINGLQGDDYIVGSAGNNTINGGEGEDTLTYESANSLDPDNATRGVKIDATKGIATNPWGDTDTFTGIEVFFGTRFKDTMKGSGANEEFDGQDGNDRLTGGKGADIFHFTVSPGKDVITDFGNGADILHVIISGIDAFDDLGITTKDGKTTVDFGNGSILTLLGVDKSELAAEDFSFDF